MSAYDDQAYELGLHWLIDHFSAVVERVVK